MEAVVVRERRPSLPGVGGGAEAMLGPLEGVPGRLRLALCARLLVGAAVLPGRGCNWD